MTFDKPEHKQMVLELIARATLPGHLIEAWAELKEAVKTSDVAAAPPPEAAP